MASQNSELPLFISCSLIRENMNTIKKPIPILSGQIRHPLKLPHTILKCRGPIEGEMVVENGSTLATESYYLTNNFPKPHYIVVDGILENYFFPEHPYVLVYLITHSNMFDNLKISQDLFNQTDMRLNLATSYITRDKFLILLDNVDKYRVFGNFDLSKLRTAFLG